MGAMPEPIRELRFTPRNESRCLNELLFMPICRLCVVLAVSSLGLRALFAAEPVGSRGCMRTTITTTAAPVRRVDQGFCSVEADIFLVDGKLLVGHTRRSLKPERTLQATFLEPLKQRVVQNGGRVYKTARP